MKVMEYLLLPFSKCLRRRSQVGKEDKNISALLQNYQTPGVYPPSSRIDPGLKLHEVERRRLRVYDLWRYPFLVVSKVIAVSLAIIIHHIWGPRKKSWSVEMTLLSSLMHDVGRHAFLVDISIIRMMMGLGGLVPLPSDALVTPVSFRVRKRDLRGILAEFDAQESGRREISGEWVVGKKLWQKLQAEYKAVRKAKETGLVYEPNPSSKDNARVILYIHGGAYYLSSAAAQRLLTIPLSKYTDCRVLAIDYRLAPETCFPGPLHDVTSSYFRLIDDLHIPPENVIVAGDSAGGGLCLALMMYLRDNQYPLPGGAILLSPWVDLTMSCDSWDSNAAYDVVPLPGPDPHLNPVVMYLGANMEKYITHPYASPLFGDFKGLPPMLIQVGEAEVLRDEITLLAHKATLAGVEVRHELYEDAVHVFQVYPFVSQAKQAFLSCRKFVRHDLPQLQDRQARVLGNIAEQGLEDEIDNESVRVVRGDGVETASGKRGISDNVGEQEQRESDDENPSSTEEYPSWGRSSARVPTISNRRENASNVVARHTVSKSSAANALKGLTFPRLRRIKSSMSTLIGDTSHLPSSSKSPSGRLRGHSVRLPNQGMSELVSPAPPPSIRRSSTSHPDISSLVHQWTNSGPANRTTQWKNSEPS